MASCTTQLDAFGIEHEVKILSAHRDPAGVMEWASSAASRGIKVIIAAAGGAAHLPGVVAAWTDLPVIGVPMPTEHLGGGGFLFHIPPMPAGLPVPTLAIGHARGQKPAWLAARILALQDDKLAARHHEMRKALAGR